MIFKFNIVSSSSLNYLNYCKLVFYIKLRLIKIIICNIIELNVKDKKIHKMKWGLTLSHSFSTIF